MKVTKRNGSKEDFDIVKVKQSIAFACENVDVNPLELESRIDYFLKDGIKTSDIQLNIIDHAKQLASPENPEWLLVAGHAFAMHEMHNSIFKDKSFYEAVSFMVNEGFYTEDILDKLYFRVRSSQESFPVTATLKRAFKALIEEGVSEKCISAKDVVSNKTKEKVKTLNK